MMFLSRMFPRRAAKRDAATRLFEQLNGQSRQTELFAEGLVGDTFEGRFEAVTLHAAIIMRRLKQAGAPGARLAHKLFEKLFSSFDYAHREAGVGDLIVGKKMRKLAEAFYGRTSAYESAFDQNFDVSDVISRNLIPESTEEDVLKMAAYASAVAEALDAQTDEALLSGELSWPKASKFFS